MPKELKDKLIREVREEKKEFASDVLTKHKKYNEDLKAVENISLSLEDDESSGTQKFFALAGPILDVIENGYTLIVDELDSKLHPNLVCKIVSLFNSKEFNKKNAQLIFNTHDTNLLSSDLFRRDQIWFANKNKYGEAKLYSLADFKSDEVRKKEHFEDNYINGKYGAVPFLGFFDNLNFLLTENENEGQKS
jgi:AAA15 family ATPase/GTPase